MLMDLFALPESVSVTVADEEVLSLGGKTLDRIHTPWVHWPRDHGDLPAIGSYGWGGKTLETLSGMIPNLKVAVIDPVLCKGKPSPEVLSKLDQMAETIAGKHRENGFV